MRETLKLDPFNKPIVGREARELTAEFEADAHAARVRDYGPEDAATYEQRVAEGAAMPVTQQQEEWSGTTRAIAGTPDFDSAQESRIGETYRLNRAIGYAGFRQEYFDDPDAIREWPDPMVREKELRSFWDAQGDYSRYRRDFSGFSTEQLAEFRDALTEKLAADTSEHVFYYNAMVERGRGSVSSDYDKALDEAAGRGSNRAEGRER